MTSLFHREGTQASDEQGDEGNKPSSSPPQVGREFNIPGKKTELEQKMGEVAKKVFDTSAVKDENEAKISQRPTEADRRPELARHGSDSHVYTQEQMDMFEISLLQKENRSLIKANRKLIDDLDKQKIKKEFYNNLFEDIFRGKDEKKAQEFILAGARNNNERASSYELMHHLRSTGSIVASTLTIHELEGSPVSGASENLPELEGSTPSDNLRSNNSRVYTEDQMKMFEQDLSGKLSKELEELKEQKKENIRIQEELKRQKQKNNQNKEFYDGLLRDLFKINGELIIDYIQKKARSNDKEALADELILHLRSTRSIKA